MPGRPPNVLQVLFFSRQPRPHLKQPAQLAQRLIAEGKAAQEIADTFNVHITTIYRLSAAMDSVYPKPPIP